MTTAPLNPSLAAKPRTMGALLPLVGADTQVPLLDGRWVPYGNLDGAASAPALQTVADRVSEVLPWYSSVHRGAGYLSQVSTSLYEDARRTIGDFVEARESDVTIITRHTTDSVNLLAACVPGMILVVDVEHHANLLPWQRSQHGAVAIVGEPTVAETLAKLEAELVGDPFALVAVTGASNVTGESLPIERVVSLAHANGARVFVDGAQLLAHHRFSLTASDVDYVAFSGHKLYAPYGAGALVGRRDWLDEGPAYLAGGGAVRRVELDRVQWAPSPARHEGGTPNVIGAVALAAASETISGISERRWVEHEAALRQRLLDGLRQLDGVRVARLWADSVEPVGVVTFTVDGADPGLVAAYLSAEHGLGVRDGRFCAHPLLQRLGLPDGAVRASIGVGTTSSDIDRLVRGVGDFVAGRPQGEYQLVDGLWDLVDDPRPLPHLTGLSELARTASACQQF